MQNKNTNFGEIDLVNIIHQTSLFMYVNDFAYKQLPEELKHYTIEQHNADIKEGKKPNYSPENKYHLDSITLFKKIMEISWDRSSPFSIIDIGSQYGSFSMDLGAFIKKTNHDNSIYAFDCGIASDLCAENIKINQLDDIIKFEKKAVTNNSLPQTVFFDEKHSEDNHIVARNYGVFSSYIVDGIKLDDYFVNHTEKLLIKIDTQGVEPLVFEGMKNILQNNPTIMFEFTPWTFDLIKTDPVNFLKSIPSQYQMFEFQPITNKIFQIDRNKIEEFVSSVSNSQAKWTDIFIIHENSLEFNEIIEFIKKNQNYHGVKSIDYP